MQNVKRSARCLNVSRVAMLTCLSLLLSSCKAPVVEPIYLSPPAAYLTPCKRSDFHGKTYADALAFLVMAIAERDLCAIQVEGIRAWQTKIQTEHKK